MIGRQGVGASAARSATGSRWTRPTPRRGRSGSRRIRVSWESWSPSSSWWPAPWTPGGAGHAPPASGSADWTDPGVGAAGEPLAGW